MVPEKKITLTYPDGSKDAENIVLGPLVGDLYILTKETHKYLVQGRLARPL